MDYIILGQYSVGLLGRRHGACAAKEARTVIPSNRDATPKPRFQRNMGEGRGGVSGQIRVEINYSLEDRMNQKRVAP